MHHPCLARIVDVEDPTWDPTVDFGGGHGDTAESYGLGQANPGTKLARYGYSVTGHRAGDFAGAGWATDAVVQVRWFLNYAVGRYGSECGAWAFRSAHGWW